MDDNPGKHRADAMGVGTVNLQGLRGRATHRSTGRNHNKVPALFLVDLVQNENNRVKEQG
jgi:hypothetical protein